MYTLKHRCFMKRSKDIREEEGKMRKGWKCAAAISAAAMLITATGCGNLFSQVVSQVETTMSATEAAVSEEADTQTAAETEPSTESAGMMTEGDPLYQALSEWQFIFTSGAGGWDTTFSVNPDGSLQGVYHDSDMGVTGPGYEEGGTLYYSAFNGQLQEYTKISENVYEVKLGELSYENTPGTEEIKDGTRYVYAEAYGLTGTDSLIVYLPGTPTADLSEAYMSWVNMNWITYLPDEFAEDIPAELPFCGLYNEKEEEGFFSESMSEKNSRFIINTVHFPGLVSQKGELADDGSYDYEDADPAGMYRVINKSFQLPNGYGIYENQERFAKACIEETTGQTDPEGLYVIGPDSEYGLHAKTHINGNDALQISWTEGENEDTMRYVACVSEDGYTGYSYLYAVGYDPDGEVMTGEMADFLLMSLSISGSPAHLSSADENASAPEKQILAYVSSGPTDSTILVDEVEMISGSDTEKLKENGIDPEDVTNDYAIVGADGKNDEYPLTDDCIFYVQFPQNPLQPDMNASGLREHLGKGGQCLMNLYLDRDGRVLLGYEPYTP